MKVFIPRKSFERIDHHCSQCIKCWSVLVPRFSGDTCSWLWSAETTDTASCENVARSHCHSTPVSGTILEWQGKSWNPTSTSPSANSACRALHEGFASSHGDKTGRRTFANPVHLRLDSAKQHTSSSHLPFVHNIDDIFGKVCHVFVRFTNLPKEKLSPVITSPNLAQLWQTSWRRKRSWQTQLHAGWRFLGPREKFQGRLALVLKHTCRLQECFFQKNISLSFTREVRKVWFMPSSFQNRSAKLNKNKSTSTLYYDLHTWNKYLDQMTIEIIKFIV